MAASDLAMTDDCQVGHASIATWLGFVATPDLTGPFALLTSAWMFIWIGVYTV